jgi:hypothetical protein
MSMRKRRKHCANILGRDAYAQKMFRLGYRTKFYYMGRFFSGSKVCIHLTVKDQA